MRFSEAVQRALARSGPVVALESTIIAHGFPQPDNLDVALAMEGAVRDAGAIPATIGVIDGEVVVGLSADELSLMATSNPQKVNSTSLPIALAAGGSGATTVSATVRVARRAGIAVMATGGIGGVHRDHTDVSADLPELGRGKIAVVSSGAKAFLDLAATLQRLETEGVLVVGYRTATFPAFYEASSGLPLPHSVDSPQDAAALVGAAFDVDGAVLIANPLPESEALRPQDVAHWVEAAMRSADEAGVDGPARSPFVLKALAAVSDGATTRANAALAVSNASLAGEIASALS